MGFRCRRCGRCCSWPGCVKLLPGEAERIAAFLGMSETEFIERHTRISADRQCLSLNEDRNGSCIFLSFGGDGVAECRIDPVKPRQCREFPERWNFPDWRKECPGIVEE